MRAVAEPPCGLTCLPVSHEPLTPVGLAPRGMEDRAERGRRKARGAGKVAFQEEARRRQFEKR